MAPYALCSLLALAASVAAQGTFTPTAAPARRTAHADVAADVVRRQAQSSPGVTTSPLPLTAYQYPYSALPYQVNPYPVGRGPQFGFNQCNATTENDKSNCQTLIMNSLVRFGFNLMSTRRTR